MDRDGCHVLRGCRRISDLEIALGSLNSNCSSNAGRPRRSGRDHSRSYRNSLEHAVQSSPDCPHSLIVAVLL
jgi:hypothetical protein